jgi:hypothetical protein
VPIVDVLLIKTPVRRTNAIAAVALASGPEKPSGNGKKWPEIPIIETTKGMPGWHGKNAIAVIGMITDAGILTTSVAIA